MRPDPQVECIGRRLQGSEMVSRPSQARPRRIRRDKELGKNGGLGGLYRRNDRRNERVNLDDGKTHRR